MLQVLRFFCVWDDRVSLLGDRRPYRLHYFLEDDTVEVLEVRSVPYSHAAHHAQLLVPACLHSIDSLWSEALCGCGFAGA
jgi:DUF1126 PH-like domain